MGSSWISQWLNDIEMQHKVNPIVFAIIYIGAIPFFTLSVGWIVKNYRNHKSLITPVLSASFFFVSAYLYLIVFGENVPSWVYILLAVMVVYGIISTTSKVRRQIK